MFKPNKDEPFDEEALERQIYGSDALANVGMASNKQKLKRKPR